VARARATRTIGLHRSGRGSRGAEVRGTAGYILRVGTRIVGRTERGRGAHPPSAQGREDFAKAMRPKRLVVSVVLNVVLMGLLLAVGARRIHAHLNSTRSPIQVMRADHFHELAASGEKADVVMFGDSTTEFANWSELLGRPIANRGIAGETVEDLHARLEDVVALRPKIVFILAGMNDLHRGASPKEVSARYGALLTEMKSALPETRLVVQAVLPVRDSLASFAGDIAELNGLLARHAKDVGATWLDVGSRLADRGGLLAAQNTRDGSHLTGVAYRIWAAAVKPLLPPQTEPPLAAAPPCTPERGARSP